MKQETKGKLEVSREVVEQLNAMVRNSAAPVSSGQAPRSPGPTPSPSSNIREDSED